MTRLLRLPHLRTLDDGTVWRALQRKYMQKGLRCQLPAASQNLLYHPVTVANRRTILRHANALANQSAYRGLTESAIGARHAARRYLSRWVRTDGKRLAASSVGSAH